MYSSHFPPFRKGADLLQGGVIWDPFPQQFGGLAIQCRWNSRVPSRISSLPEVIEEREHGVLHGIRGLQSALHFPRLAHSRLLLSSYLVGVLGWPCNALGPATSLLATGRTAHCGGAMRNAPHRSATHHGRSNPIHPPLRGHLLADTECHGIVGAVAY